MPKRSQDSLVYMVHYSDKAYCCTKGNESNYEIFISLILWPSWIYYIHEVNLSKLWLCLTQASMLTHRLPFLALCGFAILKM